MFPAVERGAVPGEIFRRAVRLLQGSCFILIGLLWERLILILLRWGKLGLAALQDAAGIRQQYQRKAKPYNGEAADGRTEMPAFFLFAAVGGEITGATLLLNTVNNIGGHVAGHLVFHHRQTVVNGAHSSVIAPAAGAFGQMCRSARFSSLVHRPSVAADSVER